MAGSPLVINFSTAATATVAHGRACYLTALTLVSGTTVTGFVNLYDATGTTGLTIAAASPTAPNAFFSIAGGASDTLTPGSGIAFRSGLVIGNSLTNSGSSTIGCTLSLSLVIE